MADGTTRPTSAVTDGDLVAATDPVTGMTTAEAVVDVISGLGDRHLVELYIGDAASPVVATRLHLTVDGPHTLTVVSTGAAFVVHNASCSYLGKATAAPRARGVRWLLAESKVVSTRTLRLMHSLLNRSVNQAMARDKVKRNVVTLCQIPSGQEGRRSKSLTLNQAVALLDASGGTTLHAYVVLALLIGARTEELRALRRDEVDLIGRPGTTPPVPPSISVLRSVRIGGDTKTRKSRRRRRILDAAGLDTTQSTPREMRHSFVSLLSDSGMPIEDISRLVGHSGTATTERVHHQQIRPVLEGGAVAMDGIFPDRPRTTVTQIVAQQPTGRTTRAPTT